MAEALNKDKQRLWPLFGVTVVWLSCAAYYAHSRWDKLTGAEPNIVGDFLAGAFAPLAFTWLVAAVFLQRNELQAQRQELQLNREVLALQAVELKNSAHQLGVQADILERQYKSLIEERAAVKIRDNVRAVCTFILDKIGGDSGTVRSGQDLLIYSLIKKDRYESLLAEGNYTLVLNEVSRGLSKSIRNWEKQIAEVPLNKVTIRKRPSIENIDRLVALIDRTMKIPEKENCPSLGEVFEFDYPLQQLRESIGIARQFLEKWPKV